MCGVHNKPKQRRKKRKHKAIVPSFRFNISEEYEGKKISCRDFVPFCGKNHLIRLSIFSVCNVQYQRFSGELWKEHELRHETELHFIQSKKKPQRMPLKHCKVTLQNLLEKIIWHKIQ